MTLRAEIESYGLKLSFCGRNARIVGPNDRDEEVVYYEDLSEHLSVFWNEFRRIVDPQLTTVGGGR